MDWIIINLHHINYFFYDQILSSGRAVWHVLHGEHIRQLVPSLPLAAPSQALRLQPDLPRLLLLGERLSQPRLHPIHPSPSWYVPELNMYRVM